MSEAAAFAYVREGADPAFRGHVYNNCSGKHAGFLALCVLKGLPTEGYLDPTHPVQLLIRVCGCWPPLPVVLFLFLCRCRCCCCCCCRRRCCCCCCCSCALCALTALDRCLLLLLLLLLLDVLSQDAAWDIFGTTAATMHTGVDGCSAPAFAMPLRHAALGFARLCASSSAAGRHPNKTRADAIATVIRAVTTCPRMVGGTYVLGSFPL
jgi:L-asparaginase II